MKPLKALVRAFSFWWLGCFTAEAGFNETNRFQGLNRIIPDGNASGASDVRVISSPIPELSSVRVHLRIRGEFNGDLYGYLRHITPSATNFCVLLNRPGKTPSSPLGYDDSGLDVIFDDAAANGDIHVYQAAVIPVSGWPVTGIWQPDGRKVDPFSVSEETPRTTTLGAFGGVPAGGEWTLFLADLESGGTNFLESWGLELSGRAQPEVTWAAPADIVYGTPLGAQQLNASSPVPGTFAYDPPDGTVLNAGVSQMLTVTFTPEDLTNYQPTSTNVIVNVLKALLTITANDATSLYGTPLPSFTVSYGGFVNGDTLALLDTPPMFTTAATQDSDVGRYAIDVSGATATNYVVQFVSGTLNIMPAHSTATLTSSSNPAHPGDLVTFTFATAAVPPSTGVPNGSVVFKINGQPTSVPLVNGVAALGISMLPAGTYVVEAEYPGSLNFRGCTNSLNPDQLINTQPVAAADEIPRFLPYGAKVQIATLLGNDSDADGDEISFVSVTGASAKNGVVVRAGEWISYTAPLGFTDDDSFTYSISDGRGQPVFGTVLVKVQPGPLDAPNLTLTDLGNGSYRIRFSGIPDVTYEIEFTDGLDPANWQSLDVETADQNGVFEIVDTPPSGFGQRFYRSVHQ